MSVAWGAGTPVRVTEGYIVERCGGWSQDQRRALLDATGEIIGKDVPDEDEDMWGSYPWIVRWTSGPWSGRTTAHLPVWAIMRDDRGST